MKPGSVIIDLFADGGGNCKDTEPGLTVNVGNVTIVRQKLHEFIKLLQSAGIEVKFAVHPVARRMPRQMDVLIAEAGVPCDLIFQIEDINDDFATTDVSLIIGADDVVNPAARTDKSSPVYGMPILKSNKVKKVYVIKCGQGKDYAGIENELF